MKEKRRTKEHSVLGTGSRYRKNEKDIETVGKENPEQSWLENSGRRPMLLRGVTVVSEQAQHLVVDSCKTVLCYPFI